MVSSHFALTFLVLGTLLVGSQGLTTFVYNFDTSHKYTPSYDLGYLLSGSTIMLNISTDPTVVKFGSTPFILTTGDFPNPETVTTQTSTTCGAASASCTVNFDITVSGVYRLKLNGFANTPALTDGTAPNQMQIFQVTVTSYLTSSGGPSNSSAVVSTILKFSDTFRDRVAKLIYLDSSQTGTFTIYPFPSTANAVSVAAANAVMAASTAKADSDAANAAADAAKIAADLAKIAVDNVKLAADKAKVTAGAGAASAAATAAVTSATNSVTATTTLVASVAAFLATAILIVTCAGTARTDADNTSAAAAAIVDSATATNAATNANTLKTDANSFASTATNNLVPQANIAVTDMTTLLNSANTAAADAAALKVISDSGTDAALQLDVNDLVAKTGIAITSITTAQALLALAKTAADTANAAAIAVNNAAQNVLTAANNAVAAGANVLTDPSKQITMSLFKVPTVSGSPYDISASTNSLNAAATPTPVISYNATSLTLTASTYLAQGFYVLAASYLITNINLVRLTFTSNSYSCPFNSAFPDIYKNFQPCSLAASDQSVQPGYPCLSLNSATKQCLACVSGYVLTNGTCLFNTTCPSGQYFHFGSCVPVDSSCDKFDNFTGACTTCKDVTYAIINGKCVAPEVNCTGRQYKVNNTCFNASDLCKAFDRAGVCTSCYDGYELKNGTCSPIVPLCTEKQYLKDNICKEIPANCPNFDINSESCVLCDRGYYVSNGVCQKIECPAGQVPSTYGIFCVSVSPLCATYDPLTGDCLTCKNQDEIVSNGVCIQISSAIAGCMAREKLGFGPCTDAVKNCQRYNLQSGECEQCISGWFKDYTGRCNLQNAVCQSDEVSIEGICVQIPQNCLRVDNVGLCTVCTSSDYNIVNGQCVFKKTCGANQYIGDNGQCVEVAPGCSSFNPTTGSCLVCANGSPANNGLCCPDGYAVLSGQCVDPNTYQSIKSAADTSSVPTCVAYHPSLGTCLACNGNFQVDPTTETTCI